MKIACVGTGKTGSKVLDLVHSPDEVTIFNRSHVVTVEGLKKCDVAIFFVPGNAVKELLPIALLSGIPCVWGSTGVDWSPDLEKQLYSRNLVWIIANNFAPLMVVLQYCMKHMNTFLPALSPVTLSINEVHHHSKKDAPSGTALKWQSLFDWPSSISYERKNDICGQHSLWVKTQYERVLFRHDACDRRAFAYGSIYAAKYLVQQKRTQRGLIDIEEVFGLSKNK